MNGYIPEQLDSLMVAIIERAIRDALSGECADEARAWLESTGADYAEALGMDADCWRRHLKTAVKLRRRLIGKAS